MTLFPILSFFTIMHTFAIYSPDLLVVTDITMPGRKHQSALVLEGRSWLTRPTLAFLQGRDGVLGVAPPIDKHNDGFLAGGGDPALTAQHSQQHVHVRHHGITNYGLISPNNMIVPSP
ncbi:hypothetical protein F4859DRAFT_519612 [Xylaria cf. heliscus]|nr:hypothetical protein F4859DRAFT_519612 [Xylaria cf. heliscus]